MSDTPPEGAARAARYATIPQSLLLNRAQIIGIVGAPGARRALIRHRDGGIETVSRGDRVFGGEVAEVFSDRVRLARPDGPTDLPIADPEGLVRSPRPRPKPPERPKAA